MDVIRPKVLGEPLAEPPNVNFLAVQSHSHAAIGKTSLDKTGLQTNAPDTRPANIAHQHAVVEMPQPHLDIPPIKPFAGVARPDGVNNNSAPPTSMHEQLKSVPQGEQPKSWPPVEQPKFIPDVEQPRIAPPVEQTNSVLHGDQKRMVLEDGSVAQFSKDFAPNKKINLVIYNHGFDQSAKGWYQTENMEQIMQSARANTLIIAPEWQKAPGSSSYQESGFNLARSLREISNKTPALDGKKINLSMVGEIDIIAHSGGHAPTETMLADKEIRGKIKNIAYLDALYRTDAIEDWVMSNAKTINRGEKGFYDFYTLANPAKPGTTARNTKHFMSDLEQAGLPTHSNSLQFNLTPYNHNDLPRLLIPKLLATF